MDLTIFLVASLLTTLATNGTSQLDCICSRIHNQTDGGQALWQDTVSDGERSLWWSYCQSWRYYVVGRCETLEQPSAALAAVSRLVPWDWTYGPPPAPAADGLGFGQPPAEGEDCGEALEEIRRLRMEEAEKLQCYIADAYTWYCSAQGLNDTKWTTENLATDHLRHQKLSQLLHAAQHITRNMHMMRECEWHHVPIHDIKAEGAGYLQQFSRYWRDSARLLPPAVTHLAQLFIPLAFEHMRNLTNDQQLHGWLRNMERVRDMLDTKLRGLVHDAQFISEQIANYKVEEDKNTTGKYIIRRGVAAGGPEQHDGLGGHWLPAGPGGRRGQPQVSSGRPASGDHQAAPAVPRAAVAGPGGEVARHQIPGLHPEDHRQPLPARLDGHQLVRRLSGRTLQCRTGRARRSLLFRQS